MSRSNTKINQFTSGYSFIKYKIVAEYFYVKFDQCRLMTKLSNIQMMKHPALKALQFKEAIGMTDIFCTFIDKLSENLPKSVLVTMQEFILSGIY